MARLGFRIRPAIRRDVPEILRLIRALAKYEKLSPQVVATEPMLRKTLFGSKPAAAVLLACVKTRVVGFALFFQNYSTFLAKPGIYLEDLFVEPSQRGRGIGKTLLAAVARIAVKRRCGRFERARVHHPLVPRHGEPRRGRVEPVSDGVDRRGSGR